MKETMLGQNAGLQSQQPQQKAIRVFRAGATYMVGDGFHVRNLFPSNDLDQDVNPFLMLDYAGPTDYPPTDHPRGVGEHPHRGFETVTIVYQGRVAHRDSAGNSGVIGPGEVQWMTAASGVVHEERHEREFATRGGVLQAVQLWVNLPKALKMSPPRYQALSNEQIPVIDLPDGAGSIRVIAGQVDQAKGPARTVTPIELYDLRLHAGYRTDLYLPAGHHVALFVLSGRVLVNGTASAGEATLAVLGQVGGPITVEASENATILVLGGQPIDEPIARYGPFVMNTRDELVQAAQDYQDGKMGHLA